MKRDYSRLKREGTFCGTIKLAKVKRRHRDDLARPSAPRPGYRVIPLGDYDSTMVDRMARADRPRVQRWVGAEAAKKKGHGPWGVSEHDAGRYSGRSPFPKINYRPWVAAYGFATATRLVATIWDTRYRYRVPRGWNFGQDDLGIYIRRNQEKRENYRYHLSSDDVRGGLSSMRAAGIRHEAEQRAATKRARLQRRIDLVEDAELARYGVWVTVDDSREAGNCASGTIAWVKRQGFDHRKRYPMKLIARLAASHPSVDRVIEAARLRTRSELAQGFCLLH